MKYALFLLIAFSAAAAQAGEPVPPMVSVALTERGHGDWQHFQRKQRRRQEYQMAISETARLELLQKPFRDRQAVGHAGNLRRCENAMRVAALCGKHAGMFFCDEKGFRPAPVTPTNILRRVTLSNGEAFNMEQCALQAMKGG